jgi:hypothetical protein
VLKYHQGGWGGITPTPTGVGVCCDQSAPMK